MKKFLVVLLISILTLPCFALTLEGGVKQVERVRQDVFKDVKYNINTKPYKMYANSNFKFEGYRCDDKNGNYTITTNNMLYSYDYNKELKYIATSDQPDIMKFPRKLYYYKYPTGELEFITYGTSPVDGYIFYSDKSLKGVWRNGVYKENRKTQSKVKVTFF